MNSTYHPDILYAQREIRLGNFSNAKNSLLSLIHQFPDFAYSYELLGYIFAEERLYDEAIPCLTRAAEFGANSPGNYYCLGRCFSALGRIPEAIAAFERSISLDDRLFESMHDLGLAYAQSGNNEAAEKYFLKALNLNPESEEVAYNLALVLIELNEGDRAIELLEKIVGLDSSFLEAILKLAFLYANKKIYEKAIICYQKALKVEPNNPEILNEYGLLLQDMGHHSSALECFQEILKQLPRNYKVLYNIGNSYKLLGNLDCSVTFFDRALHENPDFLPALNNKAALEFEQKKYVEAVNSYERVIKLDPHFKFAYGSLLHSKMHLCQWDGFYSSVNKIIADVKNSKSVIAPLPFLALVDSLELSRQCAHIWVKEITQNPPKKINFYRARQPKKRITVGYYSADWYGHATSYLIAELLELHDNTKFEIIGFSFGGQRSDLMKHRIESAFESFYEVDGKTDLEVAELSRDLGIDIAIDLKGFTANCRPGIFKHRAAPIQVSYLGYPGTCSLPEIDYIFADVHTIPLLSRKLYSEKVIYLEPSYQPNDRKRHVSQLAPKREQFGLPPDGFVFCCFNSAYKITPFMFDIWMNVLKAVPGSVLWLLKESDQVESNLKKEAESRNVSRHRIIFCDKVAISDHLARQAVADLFLDTFPYNAHTTASDALWCGLPVLTLSGESFASRVALSLLSAVNLKQLCAHNLRQYEELAIYFGLNPSALEPLKNYLKQNRLKLPLFETERLVQSVEAAYIGMVN